MSDQCKCNLVEYCDNALRHGCEFNDKMKKNLKELPVFERMASTELSSNKKRNRNDNNGNSNHSQDPTEIGRKQLAHWVKESMAMIMIMIMIKMEITSMK